MRGHCGLPPVRAALRRARAPDADGAAGKKGAPLGRQDALAHSDVACMVMQELFLYFPQYIPIHTDVLEVILMICVLGNFV